MAGEGTFPKVDGDVYFASEANNAHYYSNLIGLGSITGIGSQTDGEVGSIVIPANTFRSSPYELDIHYIFSSGGFTNMIISGNVFAGFSPGQTGSALQSVPLSHWGKGLFGSPWVGHYDGYTVRADEAEQINLTDLDPTKAIVIKWTFATKWDDSYIYYRIVGRS